MKLWGRQFWVNNPLMTPRTEPAHIHTAEQEEIRSFYRSIAELEWLLVVLVLIYFMDSDTTENDRTGLLVSMVSFAVFVLAFRYINHWRVETEWHIAIETWAMIFFVTAAVWFSDKIYSPLVSLYLLVIIACALTLSKAMTLLEVALVTCCYVLMMYIVRPENILSFSSFSHLMSNFAPFLLVAYLATTLSADARRAKNRMQELSDTDELTGLLNMRAFKRLLAGELSRSARHSHPLSVLMLDADGLKGVNDKFGHEAGNQLIQLMADSMVKSVRVSDVLSRFGGDEFVALLPETDASKALVVGERIRKTVGESHLTVEGKELSVTTSIGIAGYPSDGVTEEELLEEADAALYRSKREGRNRVSLAVEVGDETKTNALKFAAGQIDELAPDVSR